MSASAALPPFPFEHGAETGYRLCAVPLAAATPQATIKLARPLPGGGGDLLALVDNAGCLRVLQVQTQTVVAVYQIYRGSFLEKEDEEDDEKEEEDEEERLGGAAASLSTRVRPPEPCPLPWSDLAFVPGRPNALFLLLGETNVVMYTSLPPALDQADLHGRGPRASASFAYGSPLIALGQEEGAAAAAAAAAARPTPAARIRTVGVDATGSVLASGDDEGCLRVWALTRRSRFGLGALPLPGDLPSKQTTGAAAGAPAQRQRQRRSVVDVVSAHGGPLLRLTHGEALAGEEGHIITGGRDRTVKIWSWEMDEWGALQVRPLHTLLTEACEIRCLAAGGGLGLIMAGGNRGTLYCWSSLTAALEYVALGSEQPLVAVAGYAEGEEEEEEGEEEGGKGGTEGGEASVIATADAAGIVRLYRPVAWGGEGGREGGGEEEGEGGEEEEGGNTWQPVAESPLDGPAIGAFFMRPRGREGEDRQEEEEEEDDDGIDGDGGGVSGGGALLVVVSSTGMVVPWPVATLPRYPGDDNRVAPPPRPRTTAAAAAAAAAAPAAAATAAGSTQPRRKRDGEKAGAANGQQEEEEEAEATPRQGPPPSPSLLDATTLLAPFTNLRAWERDTHLLSSGWQPCDLTMPSLHSTALVRDALTQAQNAQFPSQEIDLETASVLQDAAQAVNVHPLYHVYRGVAPRDSYTLPPPQLVPKATDPRWRAKRERRPTARDFFTPGLEEVVGGGGGGGGRGASRRGGRREGGREEGVGESPYLALYRGSV